MAKKYSVNEYVKKLQSMKIDAKPFYDIATELIARIDNRVFNKGIGGNGRSIGTYSKKPAYFSVKGSKNKARDLSSSPRGKNDDRPTFLSGKKRKSVYFTGGYDEFKSDVGKNTAAGNVNLWLSGSLRRAWEGSIDPIQNVNNGFNIQFVIKTSKSNTTKKILGILKKYPTAFNLTKGEKGYILKRYEEEFIDQITK